MIPMEFYRPPTRRTRMKIPSQNPAGRRAGQQNVRMASHLKRPDLFVRFFFLADALLLAAYVVDERAKHPLGRLLNLDEEQNFPTYFSSMQLLCVGALLGLFAWRNFDRGRSKTWLLWGLPLLFLMMSVDEYIGLHEYVGTKVDWVLPGGSRDTSAFHRTGIWMFVIGAPFVAATGCYVYALREYFAAAPGVLLKASVGFGIFMAGALGLETISNFVPACSLGGMIRVLLEEGCEMVGVTVILWAAYDLLLAHNFRLSLDAVRLVPPQPVDGLAGEQKSDEGGQNAG